MRRHHIVILTIVVTLALGFAIWVLFLRAPKIACCPTHGGNADEPCHTVGEDEQCPGGQIRGTCECPASVACPPNDPGECVLCSCG